MRKSNFIYFLLATLLFVSCSIDRKEAPIIIEGIDGINSLVETISEPVGVNCDNGGTKLIIGQDLNADGSIQEAEITSINYICNGLDGENGLNSLIKLEPVNETDKPYQQGGVNVFTGLDFNSNGVLDDDEITYTTFIANGNNGQNGDDGYSTLIRTTVIDEDTIIGDTNFEQGGFQLDSGLDLNNNGVLDDNEITNTEYVSNGADGLLVQVRTTQVTEGVLFETGLDTNENGVLDDPEVLTSNIIYNGADGTNGLNSLITTTEVQDGVIIKSGLDANNNGILDDSEVMATSTVLNGEDGLNSLINLEKISPNNTFPTGGVKISTGLDLNNNNVLDDIEISNIAYIANGRNGNDGNEGQNGLNSLVNILENTPNSTSTTIQTGIDLNNNGVLEDNEVTNFVVIEDGENGVDGKNGLCSFVVVVDEPVGDNCQFGGVKITTGKDLNDNKVFDNTEIQNTEYVCEWRPCTEVVETEVVIDFEEFEHGFYNSSKGVSISTSNGCDNKIKVLAENSTFGQSSPKFGTNANNMIGVVADCTGRYESGGGVVFFNFSEPTDLVSLGFLDSDHREDNNIKIYFANGNVETVVVPKVNTTHSNQIILLPYTDVIKIEVHSCESFALDSLRFKKVIVINNCE